MSEWISVKERLPDGTENVLGFSVIGLPYGEKTYSLSPYYILDYRPLLNSWNVLNDSCPTDAYYDGFEPTHWMPLPKPPSEEK